MDMLHLLQDLVKCLDKTSLILDGSVLPVEPSNHTIQIRDTPFSYSIHIVQYHGVG